MLLGEVNREAPAQAELRPTCAGATDALEKLKMPKLQVPGFSLGLAALVLTDNN